MPHLIVGKNWRIQIDSVTIISTASGWYGFGTTPTTPNGTTIPLTPSECLAWLEMVTWKK